MSLATACSKTQTAPSATPQAQATTIGGAPVATLERPRPKDLSKPQFLAVEIAPGRGMNVLQVKAYIPGKGDVDLIASPSLPEIKQRVEGDNENENFKIAGAILVPYPNRIRGKLSADGKTIEAKVGDKTMLLPANWPENRPGAEKHSIHGLIMNSKFEDVKQENGAAESTLSAVLHAGDFSGRWPSKTDISVQSSLKDDAVEVSVTTKNVGTEPLPMAIGWHPYFAFPSGDRTQARLHLPATERAVANNYDDAFPTGKIVKTKSTDYDFTAADGKALGTMFLDDCFTSLSRNADGNAVIEVTDPAAKYGLRITALSKEIKSVQVYAPPQKNFVAVEPQFNLADPYSKIWGKTDTGIVTLKPGESVTWRVKLELFVPQSAPAPATK